MLRYTCIACLVTSSFSKGSVWRTRLQDRRPKDRSSISCRKKRAGRSCDLLPFYPIRTVALLGCKIVRKSAAVADEVNKCVELHLHFQICLYGLTRDTSADLSACCDDRNVKTRRLMADTAPFFGGGGPFCHFRYRLDCLPLRHDKQTEIVCRLKTDSVTL